MVPLQSLKRCLRVKVIHILIENDTRRIHLSKRRISVPVVNNLRVNLLVALSSLSQPRDLSNVYNLALPVTLSKER